MIIDLNSIETQSREFDFTLNTGWWKSERGDFKILGFDGLLECHIEIVRAGIRYILDGHIFGNAWVACDRCLESYRRLLDVEFRLFLSTSFSGSEDKELELSEDDMSVQFVEDHQINLKDVVRDQIVISLPMKSLCHDDCLGLCPVCGANLNEHPCKCRRVEGHPGFAKLKVLSPNGEH